jgi:ketosteroid isomerase-like protein
MNEQQNIKLVQQAYDDYARGDLDHLLSCMTPHIEWEIPTVPSLAFTGKRRGHEEVAEYFRLANEKQALRQFTPKEFIAEGDKVVVLGFGAWTAKDTGRDFESDWVHVFTVKDGQIAAFREFMDAHLAVEAFECFPLNPGVAPAISPPAH